MQSNTPQFDTLIEPILEALVPHTRGCKDCKEDFELLDGDIDMLRMMRVPPPIQCPSCRNRNRLSFANYATIYKRACNVPGHTETLISTVAPVMPWITYDHETYYGDSWDPKYYARDIELDKDFFTQFLEMEKLVPQPGVRRGSDSPNSDYSFYGKHMKDCYYVFGGRRSEDIMYGSSIYDSKHLVDSYFTREIDIGYENVTTESCFKCFYAYFSSQCLESTFLYDCRNCQNCFGCVNLRSKNYCWFNEQLSKEEYIKRRTEVDLGHHEVFEKYKSEFWAFVKKSPVRALRVLQSENVVGNDIKRSKNCFNVFQTEDSENVRHANFAIMKMKDSMDANHGGHAERLYNTQNVASSSGVTCSFAVKDSFNCEYILTGANCTNCFGCIALKNSSFCIFNKQYTEKEYFEKLDIIKTSMLKEGTYGTFFPMSFSPVAYNSSMAHIMYPMIEGEAKAKDLYWQDEKDSDMSGLDIIMQEYVPDSIDDIDGTFFSKAFIGVNSGKPYRLLEREVDFYKQHRIPVPAEAPYERMLSRFNIQNYFRISKDICTKCSKEIDSAYPTIDGWRPYCETCYQNEIL